MAQTTQFRGTARHIDINPETGTRSYFYHDTAIVIVSDGAIRLNSGGWRTATTKRAMNQASDREGLGFTVVQRKGEWFVLFRGEERPFTDWMLLGGA